MSKKIIFYGTPEIAAYQLEKLHKNNYNIVAVVTQPDKPKGRGHEMQFTPVKEVALKYMDIYPKIYLDHKV